MSTYTPTFGKASFFTFGFGFLIVKMDSMSLKRSLLKILSCVKKLRNKKKPNYFTYPAERKDTENVWRGETLPKKS